MKLNLKVYTGKKYKIYAVKSNSKGIAEFNTDSLKAGTHKVIISSANRYYNAKSVSSKIKVT